MEKGWLAVFRQKNVCRSVFAGEMGGPTVPDSRDFDLRLSLVPGGVCVNGVTIPGGTAARVNGKVFVCLHALQSKDGSRQIRLGSLVGASDAMVEVMYSLASAGLTREPVLLLGESGTGKELAADYLGSVSGGIHALNMGAIPADLVEAELFGWARGAFTGAVQSRAGALEAAKAGVLFLDEVAEAPAWVQVKLLRVIDSLRFRRLGTTRDISMKARIVAATNVDPVEAIADGRLRLDLLERMACHVIKLPPLRSRPADICCLAGLFSRSYPESGFFGVRDRPAPVSVDVMDVMRRWPWPGNVRELKNVVSRVLLSGDDGMSDPDLVGRALEAGRVFAVGDVPITEITRQQEISRLNLPRSTYYYRLKRGRIPSDTGPRRAPVSVSSKT